MSKRTRKEPEKLTYDEPDEKEESPAVGSGTPLGEIEAVKTQLSNSKKYVEAVEALHWLVFKSKGKAGQQRKRLKTFAGLVYGNDPETERQRLVDRANKNTLGVIRDVMDLLALDRSGKSFDDGKDSKENMCERLVEFLECPQAGGGKKKGGSSGKKAASTKSAKTDDSLAKALMVAVAKRQVEADESADKSLKEMVKAAEDYVGLALPKEFKAIMKAAIVGDGPDDDDDDDDDDDAAEEPAAKKPKTDDADKKPAAKKPAAKKPAKKKDEADGEDDEPAEDAPAQEEEEEEEAEQEKAEDADEEAPAEDDDKDDDDK